MFLFLSLYQRLYKSKGPRNSRLVQMEAVLERQMERCWKPVEMEVNRNRNDLRV